MAKIKFYQYEKCSTCRQAKAWLEKHKVEFENIPIVDHPPSTTELKSYIELSGKESRKFFNTSGQVYREQKIGDRMPTLSHKEQIEMLAANGKLIKRPLLVGPGFVLVGFDEKEYAKNLG